MECEEGPGDQLDPGPGAKVALCMFPGLAKPNETFVRAYVVTSDFHPHLVPQKTSQDNSSSKQDNSSSDSEPDTPQPKKRTPQPKRNNKNYNNMTKEIEISSKLLDSSEKKALLSGKTVKVVSQNQPHVKKIVDIKEDN